MASDQAVIFDLDGTLIDSSESILSSYQAAFSHLGRTPVLPLSSAIVGPPLRPTLQMLSGSSDPEVLDALTHRFIAHYDIDGYKDTTAIEGSASFLRELAAEGISSFIATNKRIAPTKLIVEHLGWSNLFKGVYSLDSWGDCLSVKEQVIRRIISLHRLDPLSTIYVGDRDDDRVAAQQAGVPFFLVPWGYGPHSTAAMCGAPDNSFGWESLRQRLVVH